MSRKLEFLTFGLAVCLCASPSPAQDCYSWVESAERFGPGDTTLAVFDSLRNRTVFLASDGLWTWDGQAWEHLTTSLPPYESQPRVAYDSYRDRIVLYTGNTWEWDGTEWSLRSQSGPGPRSNYQLAFDGGRGVVVLHGGQDDDGIVNDTWEWEGTNWTLRSTLGPYRRLHVMAYDSIRNRIAMFGGLDENFDTQRNIWEWDGANWSKVASDVGPASTRDTMVFDSQRGVLILTRWSSTGWQAIWEWDGVQFTNRNIQGPNARDYAGLAYDSARNVTVLYGGQSRTDLWEWDGLGWTLRGGAAPNGAYLAFDRQRGLVVGVTQCCGTSETWTHDGSEWLLVSSSGPPPRREFAMAYDESRDVIVLFGGYNYLGNNTWEHFDDTWEWDGVSWNQVADEGPSPRRGHAMTFDAERGMVVLFGGSMNVNSFPVDEYGDTWGWDGSVWTQLATTGPSPRYWHAMTYARDRSVTVLFGGTIYTGLGGPGYGDLWEWDGTLWTQKSTPGSGRPGTGYNYSLIYDEARHVSVLVSGHWFSDTGGVSYEKTWEWDGLNWVLRIPSGSPRGVAVYNNIRNVSFLLDPPYTWEYPWYAMPAAAPVAESLTGCAECPLAKNRYLSFYPPQAPSNVSAYALRVVPDQMPTSAACSNVPDFSDRFLTEMWVGDEVLANGNTTGLYKLSAAPVFRDWSDVPGGIVHVADCNIVPCASYSVEAVSDIPCDPGVPAVFSDPVVISTSAVWADVVGSGYDELPNGIVDFTDVSACVDRFRNATNSPPRTWCDLGGDSPTQGVLLDIDFSDVSYVVDAFRGRPYPFAGPTAPDPCP